MSTLPGMPHLGVYRLITADPPWLYERGDAAGGHVDHYAGMPIEDICAMNVGELAAPDRALLGLWCTGPLAAQGAHVEVARAWGFTDGLGSLGFDWVKVASLCNACGHRWEEHAQREPWCPPGRCGADDADGGCACPHYDVRMTAGTGSYTMQGHEHLWLYHRGGGFSRDRVVRNVRNTVFAPIGPHSAKPEVVQDLLERLWPTVTPRLELFARRRRPGWACWGNGLPDPDLVFGSTIGASFPTTPKLERPAPAVELCPSMFPEEDVT